MFGHTSEQFTWLASSGKRMQLKMYRRIINNLQYSHITNCYFFQDDKDEKQETPDEPADANGERLVVHRPIIIIYY